MTSYKAIVRGLIKTYITDYFNRSFTGWVDIAWVDALTLSGGKCLFSAYVLMFGCEESPEFRVTGEILPSGSIVTSFVEIDQ